MGQLKQLAADGFVVLNGFLDRFTIDSLIRAVESLDIDARSSRVRRGAAFARRNLLELEFVRELIRNPKIIELMDTIAPGAIAVRAILFDKTASANWTVPWHQDRSIAVRERINVPGFGPWSAKAGVPHVQPPLEILHQMVTLRFHLDACGPNNGPLRVIPATHHKILSQEAIENLFASGEQAVCTTDAGGLLVMRPLILHASSPAIDPSHRRVVHIEFGPPVLPAPLMWAATSPSD
jgi:hypothetical protein